MFIGISCSFVSFFVYCTNCILSMCKLNECTYVHAVSVKSNICIFISPEAGSQKSKREKKQTKNKYIVNQMNNTAIVTLRMHAYGNKHD